jgi:anti-sigma factor RsiW
MKCEETLELLDAFHDGELQPTALAAMETHLRGCRSCSAVLATHESLRCKLRSLGRTPAPAALIAKLKEKLGKANSRAPTIWNARLFGAMAASHLLAIALGGALGFALLQDRDLRHLAVQQTIAAHVRSLIDERTLLQVASSDSHNVRPWFMGKLNFSPPVAELNNEEFPLLGARVDYLGGRYVAALVYGRRKHRINLFVEPANDSSGAEPSATAQNGYNVLAWRAGGFSFRAVSDVDTSELVQFAELVRSRNQHP